VWQFLKVGSWKRAARTIYADGYPDSQRHPPTRRCPQPWMAPASLGTCSLVPWVSLGWTDQRCAALRRWQMLPVAILLFARSCRSQNFSLLVFCILHFLTVIRMMILIYYVFFWLLDAALKLSALFVYLMPSEILGWDDCLLQSTPTIILKNSRNAHSQKSSAEGVTFVILSSDWSLTSEARAGWDPLAPRFAWAQHRLVPALSASRREALPEE
jgi:hypothetical protein